MNNSKNDRVVSVRLSSKEVERLEDISKQWDISVSSVVRTFVTSCLYSLPSDVASQSKSGESKVDKKNEATDNKNLKASNDGYRKTNKKVKIKEKVPMGVKFPGTPRNDPCPCGAVYPDGRRKKYKHCCGK